MIIGGYNTATNGWTLTSWKLSAAEQKTNLLDKPNGDGSWDFSTALTEEIPRYKDRTLTATFECSEGTRTERAATIKQMINTLDGFREVILLPDDVDLYIIGRIHVASNYNALAHASVTVTAICEPWKYSTDETTVTLTASTTEQTAVLVNDGRRAVVPTLTVEGTGASVLLKYGSASKSFSAGTYQWPDLLLKPGSHPVKYSGTGKMVLTYREAVLE